MEIYNSIAYRESIVFITLIRGDKHLVLFRNISDNNRHKL